MELGDNMEFVTGNTWSSFPMDHPFNDTWLLKKEHNEFCERAGINPEDMPFEDLVKARFASDATIWMGFCYSAQGGEKSVGYAFKELLPDATVYGATGKVYPIPYTTHLIVPWPFSRWVEIELE